MSNTILTLTALLATLAAPSAFAYLDPGSGSMLLQVVLGGLAAVGVAAKLYWHRLKHFLRLGRKPQAGE
jgi:hypothetical protein